MIQEQNIKAQMAQKEQILKQSNAIAIENLPANYN